VSDDDIIEPEDYVPGEPPRRLPKMPPEIAKAIIAVCGQVKSLVKDDTNKFANYKFASVDTFYEAIGPLMAGAGIFVFADEVDTSVERRESTDDRTNTTKVSNWLISTFELMIYHESGTEWGPIRRKMQVLATGPQAYGSGQSYVEKYFLRGLFKVPTGEGDADSHEQTGLPARQQRPSRPPPRQPAPPHHPDTGEILAPHELALGDSWVDFGMRFIAAIKTADNSAVVDDWVGRNADNIHEAREKAPKAYASVERAIAAQHAKFAPPPAANGAAVSEANLVTEADAGDILAE